MVVLAVLWSRTIKSFGLIQIRERHFRPAITSTPKWTYVMLIISFLVWGVSIALAVVALNNDESYLYSSDNSYDYRSKRRGIPDPYGGIDNAVSNGPLVGCISVDTPMA